MIVDNKIFKNMVDKWEITVLGRYFPRSSGSGKTKLQGRVKGQLKKRQTEEVVGRQYFMYRADKDGFCQYKLWQINQCIAGKGLL